MVNEKARYQEIVSEDSEMFMAANDGIITYDEYYESNSVASAIEEILSNKHGEEVVRDWRLNNPDDIVVECSADQDWAWYYESE
jgi:hypothetical protein|tara:strand:+ start:309 stop:560 length:252 start_codon:yes stop_codon:yes gene_type:complete